MDCLVLSPFDPRRARTNSISDLQLCEGLAEAGARVRLVVPEMEGAEYTGRERLWDLYGMEPTFEINYLPTGVRVAASRWRLAVPQLRGHLSLAAGDWVTRPRAAFVLSRNPGVLIPYLLCRPGARGPRLVLPWVHSHVDRWRERAVHRASDGILATNAALAVAVQQASGIAPERCFVTGNPLRRERLTRPGEGSKEALRTRLGLDASRPLVVYSGKIFLGMQEMEYLLEVAARIPECDVLLTGGKPHVLAALRKRLSQEGNGNVHLTGFLDRVQDVWDYQAAADVLVAYYSARDHAAGNLELPNKLAEYMSTANAVVVADLPPVRDLLDEENAYLVPPDRIEALVSAIRRALADPDERRAKGSKAARAVEEHTYERVAARLLAFADGLLGRAAVGQPASAPAHDARGSPRSGGSVR